MENPAARQRFLLAGLYTLIGFAAVAQDAVPPSPATPITHEAKAALERRCREVRHQMRADVEYKPGTTAKGWTTKSPNLTEPLTINPSDVKIPLNVPIKGYVTPGTHTVDLSQTNANLGTLTLQDGQLLLDGKPLTPEDPRLNSVCNK